MELKILGVILILSFSPYIAGQNASTVAPTTTASTTTVAPEDSCSKYTNDTCENCVSKTNCFFCDTTQVCSYYSGLMPGHETCGSLADVHWGICKINFKVLIISVSAVGGLLLLGLIVCCCCCCRKRKKLIWARDQAKWEQQREELKMKSGDRKRERQSRTDEIRRKYGLMKDDNAYHRFDA